MDTHRLMSEQVLSSLQSHLNAKSKTTKDVANSISVVKINACENYTHLLSSRQYI